MNWGLERECEEGEKRGTLKYLKNILNEGHRPRENLQTMEEGAQGETGGLDNRGNHLCFGFCLFSVPLVLAFD